MELWIYLAYADDPQRCNSEGRYCGAIRSADDHGVYVKVSVPLNTDSELDHTRHWVNKRPAGQGASSRGGNSAATYRRNRGDAAELADKRQVRCDYAGCQGECHN